MIIVTGRIVASEDDIAAMREAIAAMEAASRAEAGCHDYTFSVELSEPTVLRVTECWESVDALRAHFDTPHMAGFQAAMAAHPPQSVDLRFYEANEISLS